MECSRLNTANGRKAETDDQRAIRLQRSADRASKWRKNNPDHENTKIVKKLWDRAHPEKKYMDVAKRRASKLKRTPVWLDVTQKAEIEFTYLYCSALRSIGMDVHVDHIVPLQGKTVSGMHVPWNLQVIHAKDNLRKANNLRTS
jgi:5-methylcytosine-specific restriction endonuclease McrA